MDYQRVKLSILYQHLSWIELGVEFNWVDSSTGATRLAEMSGEPKCPTNFQIIEF